MKCGVYNAEQFHRTHFVSEKARYNRESISSSLTETANMICPAKHIKDMYNNFKAKTNQVSHPDLEPETNHTLVSLKQVFQNRSDARELFPQGRFQNKQTLVIYFDAVFFSKSWGKSRAACRDLPLFICTPNQWELPLRSTQIDRKQKGKSKYDRKH